jgi:hypothetical protein
VAHDDIERHLIAFAMDQIETIGGWRGLHYVRACLDLWRREYGDAVADRVARRVREEVKKRRRK